YIGPPEHETSISLRHYLQYGASMGSLITTGPPLGGYRSNGVFKFAPGFLIFESSDGAEANSGFAFACDAMSITHIRVNLCRVVSNDHWDGNANACIGMYRLPTGEDPPPPPDDVPDGNVRLSHVVSDMHARCGLPAPDVSELED